MTEVRADLQGRDPEDPLHREFDALVGDLEGMPTWDDALKAEAWGLKHDEIPHLLGRLGISQGSDFVFRGKDFEDAPTNNLVEPFTIESTGEMGWRVAVQGEEKEDESGPYKPVTHFVTDAVSDRDQDPDMPAEPSHTWGGEEIRIRPQDGQYPELGSVATQFTFEDGKLVIDTNVVQDEALDRLTHTPAHDEVALKLEKVLKGFNPLLSAQITEEHIETALH